MTAQDTELAPTDVAAILCDPAYVALERTLAEAIGQPVLSDHFDAVLPLVAEDLSKSGLTLTQVTQLLTTPRNRSVAFGVALMRGEAKIPEEQEWDPDEGNQQENMSKGELVGLSPGFALLALSYLHFLDSDRDDELLSALNRRRVPNAKGFLKRLKRYHRQASAV